jgi:hypothetical protein
MHGVTEICPECQFDPSSVDDATIADRFDTFAKRYPIPMTRLLATDSPDTPRTRPDATTWSAAEYVGHVATVFEETSDVLHQSGGDEPPVVPETDVDASVAAAAFNDRPASELAARAATAAGALAADIRSLPAGGLDRPVRYSTFTVPLRLIVIAGAHEGHHHLLDVGRVLRTIRQR